MIPEISGTVSFSEMLKMASSADIKLFCYEGDGTMSLKAVLSESVEQLEDDRIPEISVVIGSEGGFSLNEVKMAEDAGLIPVGLGKRILRTETASGFVLGCICYELEL